MRFFAGLFVFAMGSALAAACGTGDAGAGGSGPGGAGSTSTTAIGPGATSTSTSSSGAGGSVPSCDTDAWATYGHDGARTFASNGCIAGAVTKGWSYTPAPPPNRMLGFVEHAIADKGGAYLQWAATNPPYIGTTAVDRVGSDGTRTWTWDSGTDSNLGNWVSLAWTFVVVNDDGIYYLNQADGMVAGTTGVDWWGLSAFDGTRLEYVNNEHVDGPGIMVGALDMGLKQLYNENSFGNCRIDAGDTVGGMAVDGNTMFYAPVYSFGDGPKATFTSGIYAFDTTTGMQAWTQPATAYSTVSAKNGLFYLVEQGNANMLALTARKQSDGTIAWQAPFMSAGAQAPVLAENLVIVAHDSGSISAFDAKSGGKVWTASIQGAQVFPQTLPFSGGCVNGVSTATNMTTSMAAALASRTLVVAAQDKLYVVGLEDGKTIWSGKIADNGQLKDPVIVGSTIYAMDGQQLVQLKGQ